MSNKTVNLAGKDLVVNSIKSMRGASEQEYMLSAVKGNTKRNTQTATASLTRLGARANASDSTSIDIYACDPRKAYSTNYGDSFYVDTAYASFNGLSFPVYIRTKKVTLSPDRNGTWAIVIKKVAGSEVWGVHIAFPSPVTAGGQTTMSWQEPGSVSFAIDDTTWIAGSFLYDSDITSQNYGVYGIVMHNEALTPASFLKNRFMQIIGEAEGSDTDDFTSWAVAMGCDAIFKRLAALEAFVGNLYVNYVTVGAEQRTETSGFSFKAHKDGGPNGEPLFDVYFNDRCVFRIDPLSGNAYFGNNFVYDAATDTVRAVNLIATGDSFFKGSFDCDVIKTVQREVSYNDFTSPANDTAQAKRIVDYMILGDWIDDYSQTYKTSRFIPAEIVGVTSDVKYIRVTSQQTSRSGVWHHFVTIKFYDGSRSELDIRDIVTCVTGGGGNSVNYLYSTNLDQRSLDFKGMYAQNGITIRLYSGGNVLEVNIPEESYMQGLSEGQLYYDSNGFVKMVLPST